MCLTGMSIAALGFGFATQIWQIIAYRALGGMFSASALLRIRFSRGHARLKMGRRTVRIYVAEMMPQDQVTRAYSLLSTSNQLTVLVAPVVGASLYAPLAIP